MLLKLSRLIFLMNKWKSKRYKYFILLSNILLFNYLFKLALT